MNRPFISWLELLEFYTLSCQALTVISDFGRQTLLYGTQPSTLYNDLVAYAPHFSSGWAPTQLEPRCSVVTEPQVIELDLTSNTLVFFPFLPTTRKQLCSTMK